MSDKNRFNFFISNRKNRVQKDDQIWIEPIPVTRCTSGAFLQSESFGYGKYFKAVESYLSKEQFKPILLAVYGYLKKEVKPEHIKKIDVFLEKHGAFYHPSRIEAYINDFSVRFVLNVAISKPGKSCIKREYNTMHMLNSRFSNNFLPAVYDFEKVCCKESNNTIPMFLGEWLEGYSEFHISKDVKKNENRICVWDAKKGDFFLSHNEETKLYSQVSMILAYYFNLETFEQIFPWHHAAGDFVLSKNNGKIKVKLITARQYASMIQNRECLENNSEIEHILEALLLFFLNLSIRMRIDRLDGTGKIVWSDKRAVKGAMKGFNKALALKSFPFNTTYSVDNCFKDYMLSFSRKNILHLINKIVSSYNSMSQEVDIIKQNLDEHAETLYSNISN